LNFAHRLPVVAPFPDRCDTGKESR
jgi:hypothetical protein